jgi:hypothetical protein
MIIELLGKWLAGPAWARPNEQEIEDRVRAVTERVEGLEIRMDEVERHGEQHDDERQS